MFSQILNVSILFSLVFHSNIASAMPVDRALSAFERRQRLPAIGSGPATATDGSVIVENQVVINGLNMRFKVSAPATELVNGGGGGGAAAGTLGINVLFHGDGGQSFFDFPNQGVNSGLMGVALLSPDAQLRWGGVDPTDQTGLVRPDGPEHSAAVNQFLTDVLPTIVNFDSSKIFMEGVSGGSLMLSGFMIPTFGASLGVPGAVLGCGALAPQVTVQGDISGLRIHWQSTTNELVDLQTAIPQSIAAYEKIAVDAGLSNAQIDQLQTADASPVGGHCEFDQKDFVSGVQLLTDNFGQIINGNAVLNGVTVANGVIGNEVLFGAAQVSNTKVAQGATATGGRNRTGGRGGRNN